MKRRNPHLLPSDDPRPCIIYHPLQIPSNHVRLEPNLQTVGHLPRLCVGWDLDAERGEDEDEGRYAKGSDREDEEGLEECESADAL
jgi:hypothetical protein